MVGKCANPACSASFHSLRDGKVFVKEVEVEVAPTTEGRRRARALRYVWLCNVCCQKFAVEVRDGTINLAARRSGQALA